MPQYGRPASDNYVNTWVPIPLFENIDESSPNINDYIYSDDYSLTGDTCEVKLGNLLIPSGRDEHRIRFTYNQLLPSGMEMDLYVTLIQNNSGLATTGIYNINSTGYITGILNLTNTQASQITGYSGLSVRFFTQASIFRNLINYWTLDETAGTRYDSWTGGIDLTDINTVQSRDGKIGNCGYFSFPNNEYLRRYDPTPHLFNRNATITCWFNSNPIGDEKYQSILGIWAGTVGLEYNILYHGDRVTPGPNTESGIIMFGTSIAGGGGESNLHTKSNPLAPNQWYFVSCRMDYLNAIKYIDFSGITVASTGLSLMQSGNANFDIGYNGFADQYTDIQIDEVGIWERVLTSGELAMLFNQGKGLKFPFMKSRQEIKH